MDKKIYLIGGLALLLVIVLVVFLLTRHSTGKKTTASTKIVVWDSFDTEENFSQIFDTYQAQNKNIEIEFVKKNPASFETDSINAFAAGSGPDIWIIPNNWLAKDHDKLAVLPEKKLDPKAKKSNDETFLNTYLLATYQDNVIKSQVYGLPLFMDSLSLFYNSSLLATKAADYAKNHPGQDTSDVQKLFHSPPKTWDDLSQIIKYYGQGAIALGDSQTIDRSSDILVALMLQSGATMTTEDQTAALFQTANNQFSDIAYPGTKALEFYTSFGRKGEANYTWPASENAYQSFIKGDVAMMVDYTQKAADFKKDTLGVAEITSLPQFSNQNQMDLAYYQTLTVPKSSQNQQQAWDLILYLCSSSNQGKYLSKTGLAWPRKDKIEGSTSYLDVQNNIAGSWYNPDPAKIEAIFNQAIVQDLAGQNPQTILEGAAAQITKLLGELKQ